MLVNELLPEEYRSDGREYTKSDINNLIREVSLKYPDKYPQLADGIKNIGRNAIYMQGATLTLDDFIPGFDKDAVLAEMDGELEKASKIRDPEERRRKRNEIHGRYAQRFTDLAMDTGKKRNNNLYGVVASGARGNPSQYRSLIATPALYSDYSGEPIDMFVRRSFAEGVRPADFLASTFGTRQSVLSIKRSTAEAGDLSKQMARAGNEINVTRRRSKTEDGILLDPENDRLRGRVLARDTAGFPAGTPVDRAVEQRIREKHGGKVMVYSPLSEVSPEGISGEAFGIGYDGVVPGPGFAAGITAGTALGEPLAQGSLNAKHCLVAGTRVVTRNRGPVAIENVKSGDTVVGVTDDYGTRRNVGVIAVTDQGEQPVVRYSFADETGEPRLEICATDEHQVLTSGGKVPVGDAEDLVLPRDSDMSAGMRNPEGFLLGYCMGKEPGVPGRDGEKHVPREVWGWDRESVAGFLSGVLRADGTVYKYGSVCNIAFASGSREFLEELKILLWMYFGCYAHPVSGTRCSADPAGTFHYQLCVSGVRELLRVAPYLRLSGIGGNHAGELSELLEKSAGPDPRHLAKVFLCDSVFQGYRRCYDLTVDSCNELFSLANGALVKNTGGAFTGVKKEFSGFDYINQFMQAPETFKDRAAVSEAEGRVTGISDAPQGGKHIWVGENKHYALPGMDPVVKEGDEVEPGDALSEGLVNPRDVIRLRGLGEGRRYFSRRLKQLFDDSGQPADLRNVETITRGALDNVMITDGGEDGEYLPGDVRSYNDIEAKWEPRPDSSEKPVSQAAGRYLEEPVLHYTIGTRLTPRMLDEIGESGREKIMTNENPPPFEPVHIRLRTAPSAKETDWLANMGGSYLQKSLAESAQRGHDTDIKENLNPYPRLAYGGGFGDRAHQTGKF